MLENLNHYEAGGASSFVPIPKYGTAGYKKTVVNTAVAYGDCVQASLDDADELVDTGLVDGARSPLQAVEIAGAVPGGTANAQTHLYGIVTEKDGIAVAGTGRVVSRNVTLYANVMVPSGNLSALTPLMPDFSNDGALTVWDGTAKCIALLARKVTGTGGAAAKQLQLVHLDGVTGFAAGYTDTIA